MLGTVTGRLGLARAVAPSTRVTYGFAVLAPSKAAVGLVAGLRFLPHGVLIGGRVADFAHRRTYTGRPRVIVARSVVSPLLVIEAVAREAVLSAG